MKKSKVSILIPVQDTAKTLDRCFESIQKQTFQDFEIICIDNGSKDSSYEFLKKWQAFWGENIFKIIRNNSNLGITLALNQGLDMIESELTARIDGDDFWEPTKLEKQITFLEKNPDFGVIGTNYINFKNDTEIKITLPETDEKIKKTIIKRNPFAHSSVIFRTELIKKLGKYDAKVYMGQDYDLWLRCMPHTKFHNLQEFLCHRSIEGGISFDRQREQMKQCLKTQLRFIKRYDLPTSNYLHLLEPLVVMLTPNFIKKIKRKIIE